MKIPLHLFTLLTFFVCQLFAQDNDFQPLVMPPTGDELPITSVKFEEEEFDFGTVDAGEVVEHVYKFTNTGDVPLVSRS